MCRMEKRKLCVFCMSALYGCWHSCREQNRRDEIKVSKWTPAAFPSPAASALINPWIKACEGFHCWNLQGKRAHFKGWPCQVLLCVSQVWAGPPQHLPLSFLSSSTLSLLYSRERGRTKANHRRMAELPEEEGGMSSMPTNHWSIWKLLLRHKGCVRSCYNQMAKEQGESNSRNCDGNREQRKKLRIMNFILKRTQRN